MKNFIFFILGALLLTIGCNDEITSMMAGQDQIDIDQSKLYSIAPSDQRIGEVEKGWDYLINGDYIGSGIPINIFKSAYPSSENTWDRDGLNEGIPHDFNAFNAENGVAVVAPNCFQCHASTLNGALIPGLGNITGDFTVDQSGINVVLDQLVIATYSQNSPEWEAYFPFSQAVAATSPQLKTATVGVNPADKLAAVLGAHRNAETLEWTDQDMLGIPSEVIPTDIPPWWNLKKKNSMFYTAVGRGDFARISMASSLLAIRDTVQARRIDDNFADVIAYINSLEAPAYPEEINEILAGEGEELFLANCASCHGSYGAVESYPNLLVDISVVQTDPALINANFGYTAFTDWYNESWFAQAPHAARMQPEPGYIAPPLDGIWASAPYLHNGSVPDMESLLNSSSRPVIWERSGDTSNYNYDNLGWEYETLSAADDKFSYDTQRPGYGNQGHLFGDHLIESERKALIEYLKTL